MPAFLSKLGSLFRGSSAPAGAALTAVMPDRAPAGSVPPVVGEKRGAFDAWGSTGMLMGPSTPPTGRLVLPFAQSPWVARAIGLITGEMTAIPLKFYHGDAEYTEAEFDDYWTAPAVDCGGARRSIDDVIEELGGWYKLKGEYFILLGDDWLVPFPNAGGWPPFAIARPEKMIHLVSKGTLMGWRYVNADGSGELLLPEQVIHVKRFNPFNYWRGLAELDAALIAAQADYAAGTYNRNIMENNGDAGPIISVEGGNLSAGQRDQFMAQLQEKRRRAKRGDFVPAFSTASLKTEFPPAQSTGGDFQSAREGNREEIFAALGVPLSMANPTASYSIGAASDRYQLITSSSMPLSSKIARAFSLVAKRMTGRPLVAKLAWDKHDVFQQIREERRKGIDGLWQKGMPMEAINQYLDLGMEAFPGWDQGFLPTTVLPVEQALEQAPPADPATSPDYAETPDDQDAEEEPDEAGDDSQRAVRRMFRALQGGPAIQLRGEKITARDRALWRGHMQKQAGTRNGFKSRFTRELMKARKETLAKIERSLRTTASAQTRAAASDLIFNRDQWAKGFLAGMRAVASQALDTAGKQLFAEVGKDDPFTMPPAAALEFLKNRENKLAGVPDEVHGRVLESIRQGLDDGDTMDEIAAAVRAEFNDIDKGRGSVIAQTETQAAYGTARHEAMKQAGIRHRKWLTSGNSNVRPAHEEAHGQVVALDEPFHVDGEELDYPGDPEGSPENVINCHCIAIATTEEPRE